MQHSEDAMLVSQEGYNSYLGICLVSNFSTADNVDGSLGLREPTLAQIEALASLCQELQTRYGFGVEKLLGHNKLNPNTECPAQVVCVPVRKLVFSHKFRSILETPSSPFENSRVRT